MSNPTDQDPAEPVEPDEGHSVKPEWKFKQQLPIQERMADVIRKAKAAAEAQLVLERKRLRKMQYGS